MSKREARIPGSQQRKWWRVVPIAASGLALFVAFGGSASAAAKGLIHAGDIAAGAVTSKTIKNGGVTLDDLNGSAQDALRGDTGDRGATGSTGSTGAPGAAGAGGTNGANGANGPNGANGANGVDGIDGTNGTNGTDGIDGTIQPLSSTFGVVPIPTSTEPTTLIDLSIPAGNYVVLAKSQLSHTGAGDSIDCTLKAGGATLDRASMKTMPALAAHPMSLQAVTTVGATTLLSLECKVQVADGSANFNSLIAIPTG